MANNDSLLFVGYEEDTGAVLSVAGVTVLGVRAPLVVEDRGWRPAATKKKKFSGGADYDSGVASGYADCSRCMKSMKPGVPGQCVQMMMLGMSKEYADGYDAGWEKCRREHRTILTQPEPLTTRLAEPNASSSMFNLAIRGW